MSWEAVTWANKQKLKKSYEQIVLLVLANCADPDGEAFAKWSYKDHWWHYLSERTRLPRSSLFRHLNTLVALGVASKTMLVLADGTRRPTVKLDLSTSFDIDSADGQQRYAIAVGKKSSDDAAESPVETGDDGDGDESENTHDINDSEDSSTDPDAESPVETEISIPRPGNEPFPVLGMHKDSILNSKDSPLPPSGGLCAERDELWEEFQKVWREPMTRPSVARTVWDKIPTVQRTTAVAAGRGYFVWLGKQSRPPTPISAQTFLRESGAWAQWLAYAGDPAAVAAAGRHAKHSPAAKAVAVLHSMAGKSSFFHQVLRSSADGSVSYPKPVTARLVALAHVGRTEDWPMLDRQQAAAWNGFLLDHLTVGIWTHLTAGSRAPWPWPPRKDGTLSHAPPAEGLMTEEDEQNFT